MATRQRSTILAFAFILLAALFMPFTAFAEEGSYKSNSISGGDPMKGVTVNVKEGQTPTVDLPNVHIEDAKNFVERKGFDVVGLLQKFAEPFSIGLFILGAFLALMGAFGKSSGVMRGVLVMGLAVLVYAAVIAAPELVDFGNAWLRE